jgi:hypothetical protein
MGSMRAFVTLALDSQLSAYSVEKLAAVITIMTATFSMRVL